jgi:hypothetical protein
VAAAGTDLKIVQDQLGHSTITLTAGTCTGILPETAAVGGTAWLVQLGRTPGTPRACSAR